MRCRLEPFYPIVRYPIACRAIACRAIASIAFQNKVLSRNPDGLAKVTDIRRLDHERHLLVLAWYYTREEIQSEFGGRHLGAQWPRNAPFTYMLSSNRTITMWDTLHGKALPDVMAKLCPDIFYITTDFVRRISKAGHPHYKWMQKLLDLTPPLIFDQDGKVTKRRKQKAG